VAKTFLDCVDGMQVNHINGNRIDNRLVNLEMVTSSQNYLHGMFVNKNGIAKLTHEQAEEVKRRVALGERQVDIAKEFNVFKQTINQIVRGTGYKNSKIAMQYKGVA
jgi:DNA-binding XRE family transcriptional regulator